MKNLLIPAILVIGLIAPAFSFASEKENLDDGHALDMDVAAAVDSMGNDLDDEHILDIVATMNSMAIEAGTFASARSTSAEVGSYAAKIVDEHTNVSRLLTELAATFGLVPRDNPVSKELRMDAIRYRALLERANDPEFDLLYIDQKVVFHQNVLDMIDNQLMPAAGRHELKALLYGLFAPFSEHLAQAQEIQESLRSISGRATGL